MIFNARITTFVTLCTTFMGTALANSGDATWFNTGLGACGALSKDTDFVVALSTNEYNGGSHCFKHLNVHYQGKTIDVTVVDLCPGCGSEGIDLSPSAFQALASLDTGRIPVTWEFA